jgi:hypothetical protein
MLAKVRSRLTYSNVTATLALFVALGGTSYAVATGSIGSREIGNNSVRSKDLRNNNVRGKDVRNGTIGTRDVADGGLLAVDFKAGQPPAGERGLQGERGLPGQDATKLFAYIGQVPAEFPRLRYGSGVTGVTFAPVSPFPYAVQFDRSIRNCAVLATAGRDVASSSDASQPATPEVWISNTTAFVNWENDAGTEGVRTSFLIAAFC